jgi:hypothetical protein
MNPEIEAKCRAEGMSEEDMPYLEKGMATKVKVARVWILQRNAEIAHRMYEEVAPKYPGDQRAFMFAWCDIKGGI